MAHFVIVKGSTIHLLLWHHAKGEKNPQIEVWITVYSQGLIDPTTVSAQIDHWSKDDVISHQFFHSCYVAKAMLVRGFKVFTSP